MIKKQLIELLKASNKKTIEMLYKENRQPFIGYAKNFNVSVDDIIDAYQDAFIVLTEKAAFGELDDIKCSIKTYLFGIGKYIIFEKARKNNKKISFLEVKQEDYNYGDIVKNFFNEDKSPYLKQLQKAFSKLGKTCKEILTLFYYRGYTIEEIAEKLNYSNKNVVKSNKSRCIKKLKDIVNS